MLTKKEPKRADIMDDDNYTSICSIGMTPDDHTMTAKPKILQMLTKKEPKRADQFECLKCNFICSKKSSYTRHILTAKHKNLTEKEPKSSEFICKLCHKEYKTRMGLWQHKRKCSSTLHISSHYSNCDKPDMNSFMQLIKQNSDFKELIVQQNQTIIELAKKDTITNHNSTTHNNHQKFNLNFFLNDTCKDAMNMSEFIQNIDIDFSEIENIGKLGYVSGMTNMILSRIKQLDITKRPLHCTDLKRETMYIKDNDEWDKDSPNNDKLHHMIQFIARKNYQTIPIWRTNHPECTISDHPKFNVCVDMMKNVLGDVGKEQFNLDRKVIKKLSKAILVK